LSLEGEVVSDITVTPKRIRFRDLKKTEKASAEFTITVRDPEKVKISTITIENKLFEVIPQGSGSEKTSQYEVRFHGSPSTGRITTKMRILAHGLDKPYIDVPVVARVSSNLRYSKRLFLMKRNGIFPPKNIVISTRDGASLTVKKVEDPNNLLKLTIEKNNAPTVVIQAEVINPESDHGIVTGNKLFIYTSDKDEPTIELNYKISDAEVSHIQRNTRKKKNNRDRGWKKRFRDESEAQQ
jgi:hypothetical protein